jgi:hypothetical protein
MAQRYFNMTRTDFFRDKLSVGDRLAALLAVDTITSFRVYFGILFAYYEYVTLNKEKLTFLSYPIIYTAITSLHYTIN